MSFYAYMLRCRDGSYYVGHTDNLEARLIQHRDVLVPGYTRTRRPVRLVWCEGFRSRDEAFADERRIKGWSRVKKEALIAKDWNRIIALSGLRSTDRAKTTHETTQAAHPSRASG